MSDALHVASPSRVPRRRAAGGSPADVSEPSAAPKPARLESVRLSKSYRKGRVTIPVLRGVDMQVRDGEFLAIIGQSGSGKSTLLHLLGTLDAPDEAKCAATVSGSTTCRRRNATSCAISASA